MEQIIIILDSSALSDLALAMKNYKKFFTIIFSIPMIKRNISSDYNLSLG